MQEKLVLENDNYEADNNTDFRNNFQKLMSKRGWTEKNDILGWVNG